MSTLDILLETIAPVLENIIDNKINRAIDKISSPASMLGEYSGTDSQGKQWVIYDGSDIKSPISWSTIEADPGDRVSITVQNGKAVMDKNLTNPSAGVKGVEQAELTAQQACEDASKAMMYSELASLSASAAQESADAAFSAATDAKNGAANAWNHADYASAAAEEADAKAIAATQSASQAQTSANTAFEAANEAQGSADNARDIASVAQISANIAQTSANTALLSLSEIENVVGAAEWITAHGTYRNYPPYVTEFDSTAIYYVPSASSPTGYAIVDNPTEQGMWDYELTADTTVNPEKTYYVQVTTYAYDVTMDTEIVAGKAYYIYDAENDEYDLVDEPVAEDLPTYYERTDTVTYEPVENPVDEDLGTYYERTSLYYVLDIAESVQNYIAAHLALADDGLHIYGSSDDYAALLGIDGLDIREPGGVSVAKYGENFRVGKTDGVYLQGSSTQLSFRSSAGTIVYFGLDDRQVWSMFMEQAYVRDMIRFGNYAWVKRANGNLTMKYLED